MRAAVIGLGWWGKQIIECLSNSEKINITHGVDPYAEQSLDFFKKHNVDVSKNFDEVINNNNIDAVILATPNKYHEEQVVSAAKKGKQVFCEKPLALSIESARIMATACDKAEIILGLGHERRWEPAMIEVKDMLQKNILGKILHLESNFSHDLFTKIDKDNWRLDPNSAPAGGMTALGIHLTDFFVSFVGSASEVFARSGSIVFSHPKKDTLSVNIRFKNNITATMAVLISTPFYGRFTIFGEKGWVEVREISNVDFDDPAELVYCDHNGKRVTKEFSVVNTVKMNFEEWADAVDGKCEYRIKIDEIISNIEILDAIIKSAKTEEIVYIN
jgi:predicted dehydrogenase